MNRHPNKSHLSHFYPLALIALAGLVWGAVDINDNHSVGDKIRVYRIAVAATSEFTSYHGGKASALAEIKAIMAEVNQTLEQEFAIRLVLVSDTLQNSIIYDTAPESDPYSGDRSDHLDQNQTTLDAQIESANYDIGHVLGKTVSGSGGRAGLGVVTNSMHKARGISESSDPSATNAGFINLILHEIGHQFGAQHTFNADAVGSCVDNREPDNAFEPASGSTIMSYAGTCDSDDLQSSPDRYFHAASFEQVYEYIASEAEPHSTIVTGNSVPTISGGSDYVIPARTPFELTATASDADGDSLTYTWEQLDKGDAMGLPLFDNGASPLFRSYPPSPNPVGLFSHHPIHPLPATDRDLNFRVTVRDNNPAGGGINSDDVLIDVQDTGAPFKVTAPNGFESWTGGMSHTVTWDVAGTAANGINASQVDILFSSDRGRTFPIVLATTANDGSESITLPNITTTNARIKIRGTGNVFFDTSDEMFWLTANPALPGIAVTEVHGAVVATEDGLVGAYDLNLHTHPGGSVTVEAAADSQSEVSTDGVTYGSTASLIFDSTAAQRIYVRAVDDSIPESGHTSTITNMVTSTTSASYPLTTVINQVVVQIVDNESVPVIGVDFGSASGPGPNSWNIIEIDSSLTSLTDLLRDDGVATSIDLTIETTNGWPGWHTGSPASTSIPNHVPVLDDIGGFSRGGPQSLIGTWSDLIPGRLYGVYLFGLDADSNADNRGQMVTIAGATTLPSFTQTLSDNQLRVNDAIGSSAQNLELNEKVVAADSNGQIVVTAAPTGDGFGIAALALREILPTTPGLTLTPTTIEEGGVDGTYQLNLNSNPGGTVTLTLDADADSEISLDGTTFAASQMLTLTTTLPQNITVRAIDDAYVEGNHTSTITNTITSSTSATYPVTLALDDALIAISDNDDFGPLAGVDFEGGVGVTPSNWSTISSGGTASNITLEDGTLSSIDFTASSRNASGFVSPSPSTVPMHTPSLSGVDFTNLYNGSPTFTWSDLSPNSPYNVYVFAHENFDVDIDQTVTITGAGAPLVFSQTTTVGRELWVNGQKGSSSLPLESFAVTATSDGSGEIGISIVKGSVDWMVLGGMAIQEAPVLPGISIDTGGSIATTESGTTDTYTITLDTTPSGSVSITTTADAQSEVSLNGVDFAPSQTFSRSDTSSQTITVRAIDDGATEGEHTSRITHAITTTADAMDYPTTTVIVPVTATIEDNDTSATVSITANDATAGEPDDDGQFTVSLSGGTLAPAGGVTVQFDITGTATNGADYASLGNSVMIAAGTNSNTIDVDVTNDVDFEMSETVIITLTSTNAGNITVAGSPNDTATVTVSSDEAPLFQSWLAGLFSAEDLNDPSKQATIWGFMANPDDDELTNAEEYFHNLNPLESNEGAVSSDIINDGGTLYLEMVFRRRKAPSNATQLIQESPTPADGSWDTASGITETTSSIDATTEEVTIRFPLAAHLRRFLRLIITIE